MLSLHDQLNLLKCPHCNVDTPNLNSKAVVETINYAKTHKRVWKVYVCSRCGGLVTAASTTGLNGLVVELFPHNKVINDSLPEKAKSYLSQALDSIHAPAGAVMLSASAVDAMLKDKDYHEGSLYTRINKAAEDHLITDAMAKWAHQVRLEANDQRHADEESNLPTDEDAERSIEFTLALGEFLFVLPDRVTRGIEETKK